MKIKIQNEGQNVAVKSDWPKNETKQVVEGDFPQLHVDAYKAASEFMEQHPEFKEVVFNTELTEDEFEEDEV